MDKEYLRTFSTNKRDYWFVSLWDWDEVWSVFELCILKCSSPWPWKTAKDTSDMCIAWFLVSDVLSGIISPTRSKAKKLKLNAEVARRTTNMWSD